MPPETLELAKEEAQRNGAATLQQDFGSRVYSSKFYFHHQTRLIILVLSTLCLTLLHSNTLALNFTVICMDDVIAAQSTNSPEGVHWLRSTSHINTLFSAIAAGSLIGTLPIMTCVTHIGMRRTLTIYGLNSAIATLVLPFAVEWGYNYVFMVRILQKLKSQLQGFSIGIGFSALGAIASQWSALREAGTYIAILSTHVQVNTPTSVDTAIKFYLLLCSTLCSIITMPLAGVLCESSFGWRSLYYVQGIFSILIFLTFYCFFRDSPTLHRNVSEKELSRIYQNKANVGMSTHASVPYLHVIRDPCVIGVWLSSIGAHLGFFSFLYYGPVYVNKVLHLDVGSTGYATAIPYALSAAVKIVAGPISDRSTCVSERIRIIIFGCLSQGCMAVCFLVLALVSWKMAKLFPLPLAISPACC
ncbi:unnamed protein product [Heligmosomoides polygyrus]|uniref:MFS domain-containing protein n=1 Tax=Heligmosomoides polygyrus TaxID=6339 RepID=A0A183FKT3_HELPZ|nr:unnamed protein product [Heligmosomoides polygyrus]